eukprot:s909_g7.t1
MKGSLPRQFAVAPFHSTKSSLRLTRIPIRFCARTSPNQWPCLEVGLPSEASKENGLLPSVSGVLVPVCLVWISVVFFCPFAIKTSPRPLLIAGVVKVVAQVRALGALRALRAGHLAFFGRC